MVKTAISSRSLLLKRDNNLAAKVVRRIFWPRLIGNVLTMLSFGAVLAELYEPSAFIPFLILQPVLIPLITMLHVRLNKNPIRAEQLNLLLDGVPLGIWIVFMQFNLFPSALLITLIAMNNMAFGGPRNLLLALLMVTISLGIGSILIGVEIQWMSSERVILATLPIMVFYPILMSTLLYNYSRKLREQKKLLRHLSVHDELSGLYNRRYWQMAAQEWFEQPWCSNQQGVLLMLDIDHFKSINDQLGHAVGDAVINRVGQVLQDQMRTSDLAGRLGGEEFGVLLPSATLSEAKQIAERLRTQITKETDPITTPLSSTVSVGIAARTGDDMTLQDWLIRADRALYEAKNQGRNRSVIAPIHPSA